MAFSKARKKIKDCQTAQLVWVLSSVAVALPVFIFHILQVYP
jgi:hypothetical protein